MRSSTGKYTQQLDGFQVVREDLIVEGCGVEDLSRLARLSCHRRRMSRTMVHAERTQFRCPACGSAHVSACPIRERRVQGVPDGNTPVEIVFTTHRTCCPDCGSSGVEKVPFLAGGKGRVTKSLANTVMAFRGGMSTRQVAEALQLSWGRMKSVERSWLEKEFARISPAKVEALTIDETYLFPKAASDRKCVTIVRDAKAGAALYVGDGRGADALKGFERRLKRHRKRIRHVCMDMSGAYAKRALAFLPDEVRQGLQFRRGGVQQQGAVAREAGLRAQGQGVFQAQDLRPAGHGNHPLAMTLFHKPLKRQKSWHAVCLTAGNSMIECPHEQGE